jgi:hypothetical protein
MIKIFKTGVLECWSIKKIVLKFQKVLLGPSLQYSITPIINNVLWTTDDPIDKETQFKAVHSITHPAKRDASLTGSAGGP